MNTYEHYSRRREEIKNKKRDLASIHIPPATIFFQAAGISSIPAIKPPPVAPKRRQPPPSRCLVEPQQVPPSVTGSW